ncbi:MAG: aldehyde dehydrogenase PuuC, partial [Rhizobacter sp.]|nr:aldehyde dehydrogenase PuuC [Rhizobacter sp.]
MKTIDWHARAAEIALDGRALIAGKRVAAVTGETFDCISPINGRVLTQVARGRAADIDAAVA